MSIHYVLGIVPSPSYSLTEYLLVQQVIFYSLILQMRK